MVSLTTFADVDAELAATADYATTRDISKAKRRAAALERKLDFASQSDEDGVSIEFDQRVVVGQLDKVYAFIRQNETLTDAQRKADPSVTHADFSTFGQYRGGASSQPEDAT